MKQTNTEAAQVVLKRLAHITPTIHEVLDKATTAARLFFEKRGAEVDSCLFPDLVRYEAKCLFDSPKYKHIGYQFAVLSRNGLFLIYQHELCAYRIRFRKADEDGELPVGNLSRTLKEFCKQKDPFPLLGLSIKEMEQFESPELIKLFVVWDVDHNYVLTEVSLGCPNGEFGDMHFADEIPHAATMIIADEAFDDEAEELDDIDVEPLEKTGTDENEDDESND
jgi:hypothetical protein